MAGQNPFANSGDNGRPPEVSTDVAKLKMKDVCPILTIPSLQFVMPSKVDQMRGADAVPIPTHGFGLAPCIREACKFWNADRKDCIVKIGLEALAGLSMAVTK